MSSLLQFAKLLVFTISIMFNLSIGMVPVFNLTIGIVPIVNNFGLIGGLIPGFLLGFVLLCKKDPFVLPDQKLHKRCLPIICFILLSTGLIGGLVSLLKGVNMNDHCS
ncbi:putative peptidase S54, rhomboid [Medicago truncatula]|uniref:Putative peptidase S54, rhomboid n=1 Tax=Medicago truncatula TaxID=3880 RepID=A0A396GS24_MEDTR|nr:putative peptidase S54, rhomboid [Medicago truncatula]